MTTKKPEEFTYGWEFLWDTSVHEKIQIYFEINFVSLPDSIEHFQFLHLSFMVLGSNNYVQLKSNLKTDEW